MAKAELIKRKLKCEYLNLIIIDNQKVKKKLEYIALGCNFLGGFKVNNTATLFIKLTSTGTNLLLPTVS
jgi:hypothetical protein